MPINFTDITVIRPTVESLAQRYAAIDRQFAAPDGRAAALAEWDRLRRELESWQAMIRLRFDQDTADPATRAERDYADSIGPEITRLEVEVKRRLLADPDRPASPPRSVRTRSGSGRATSPPSSRPSPPIWSARRSSPRATPNCSPRPGSRSRARR